MSSPKKSYFSVLDDLEYYRLPNGKFHFKMVWKDNNGDITDVNEWLQTTNFVTAKKGGVEGYEPITLSSVVNSWGGLERNMNEGGKQSLADGSIGTEWWYALGTATNFQNAYPGPNTKTTLHVELYARVGGTIDTTTAYVCEDVAGSSKCASYLEKFLVTV